MRWIGRALTAAAVSACIAGVAGAMETKVMKGSFEWNNENRKGNLEATFTPAGDGKWEVAFRFEFSGQQHVYSGTAEGSLTSGTLSGKVHNEDRRRSWSFTGTSDDGRFKGTHAEIVGNGQQPTGTLTLEG